MTPVPPAAPQRPDPEHVAAHDTAWLLVQIRWVAIASQFAATVYAAQVLGIDLPRGEMATVSALLVAFNLLTALSLRPKGPPVPDWVIAAQLGFDTLAGTVLLALSGGAQNPFTLLLLVPVMLAVSLCAPSRALPIYLLANACVWGLTLLPASSGRGGGAIFLAFILASTILSWFTLRLRANLAARAAAIEALRRERAEADQLVGLGLLASGMAHELGTPLTTLAVTLDDWADLGLPDEPARGAALSAMIAEVKRCREIVSRTLRAAGRERFEAAAEACAETEFRRLLALWSTTRDRAPVPLTIAPGTRARFLTEPMFEAAALNLLDNAEAAAPGTLSATLTVTAGEVVFTLTDRGPGFPAAVLDHPGAPFVSGSPEAGRGLGLFLTRNALARLGGRMELANSDRGAVIRITLPRLDRDGDLA